MKFEEYLEKHCGGLGSEYWDILESGETAKGRVRKHDFEIALKIKYAGQREQFAWAKEYCEGMVVFAGSWVMFEYEADSILYTLKWL